MKKIFLAAMLLTTWDQAHADARYPKNIPARMFGSQQDVGSCMSESFVASLEHQLANSGLFFKISLPHLHAFAWKGSTPEKQKDVGLDMTATSAGLVNQYGAVIPDYLLPEDLEGVNEASLSTNGGRGGLRPKIEEVGLYDGQVPTQNFRFSSAYFSFTPGYNNSKSYGDFLNAVRAGRNMTLAFDSRFLYNFNPKTGMLYSSYQTKEEWLAEENHSVAVVGFDDELGGIIIRNTWNSPSTISAATNATDMTETEKVQFQSFRKKISRRPLPGYYLFPYQYVQDLAARGRGGFYEVNMDFGAFANVYSDHAKNYESLRTFFSCDRKALINQINIIGRAIQQYEDPQLPAKGKEIAAKRVKSVIYGQMTQARKLLNFAKQSRRLDGSIDRVKEFYDGKFANYYCGGRFAEPLKTFWPLRGRDRILENPDFMKHVRHLSESSNDFFGWYEFFKFLSQKEYLNDLSQ